VSNLGRVKSLPRTAVRRGGVAVRYPGVLLRPSLSRGYLKVGLTLNDGRQKTIRVHILVATAFLGARPEGLDINHRNGVKTDNRAINLEYISRSENNVHAHALGLPSQ
jgi:hypothetical protein